MAMADSSSETSDEQRAYAARRKAKGKLYFAPDGRGKAIENASGMFVVHLAIARQLYCVAKPGTC